MTGSFPTWLGGKGKSFCPMGPERLIENEPVGLPPLYNGIQESFYGQTHWLWSLSEGPLGGHCCFLCLKDILFQQIAMCGKHLDFVFYPVCYKENIDKIGNPKVIFPFLTRKFYVTFSMESKYVFLIDFYWTLLCFPPCLSPPGFNPPPR